MDDKSTAATQQTKRMITRAQALHSRSPAVTRTSTERSPQDAEIRPVQHFARETGSPARPSSAPGSPVKLAPQMDSLSRDIENISMSPEFNRSAAKLAKAGDRLDNPSAPRDEKSRLAAKLDTRFQDTKDTQGTSNVRSSSLSGLDRSLSRPPSRPSKAVNDLDGLGLDATAASLLSRQIEIQQQLDAIRASPPPTSFCRKQDESHRQYDKSQPSATQEANPLATEAAA